MRTVLALICLVSVTFVVSACGGSGDMVATVGTSEITVSEDTPTDTFYEKVRALIERGPYLPWFNACLVSEAKKIITPAEAEELESASKAEAERRIYEASSTAAGICESSGKRYVDRGASDEAFEIARSSEVEVIAAALNGEGAPAQLVSCVEGQIGAVSKRKFAMVMEGEESANERFIEHLVAECQSG